MTRPDPNFRPDSGAPTRTTPSGWTWSPGSKGGTRRRPRAPVPGPGQRTTPAPERRDGPRHPTQSSTARLDGPAARRPFSDFDPLGLSAGAPIELSAEERLGAVSQPAHRAAPTAGAAAADVPEAAAGPAGL